MRTTSSKLMVLAELPPVARRQERRTTMEEHAADRGFPAAWALPPTQWPGSRDVMVLGTPYGGESGGVKMSSDSVGSVLLQRKPGKYSGSWIQAFLPPSPRFVAPVGSTSQDWHLERSYPDTAAQLLRVLTGFHASASCWLVVWRKLPGSTVTDKTFQANRSRPRNPMG